MKILARLKSVKALVDKALRPFTGREDDTDLIRSGVELPNTRYWRRAIKRSQRLKGPGYTRAMRGNRQQREGERRVRRRALTPDEQVRLTAWAMYEALRRDERSKRRASSDDTNQPAETGEGRSQ